MFNIINLFPGSAKYEILRNHAGFHIRSTLLIRWKLNLWNLSRQCNDVSEKQRATILVITGAQSPTHGAPMNSVFASSLKKSSQPWYLDDSTRCHSFAWFLPTRLWWWACSWQSSWCCWPPSSSSSAGASSAPPALALKHLTSRSSRTTTRWPLKRFSLFLSSKFHFLQFVEKVGDKTSVCGEDGWEEGEDNTGLYSHRCWPVWVLKIPPPILPPSQALPLCSRVPAEAGPDQFGLRAVRLLCAGLSSGAGPTPLSSIR